ncbi:MFS transporter [Goodfellowiella coeruleoviolacea]|uniref:Putative proline/betaine transporter n=1 Tax=Goodfellowiella coeruleoviolacea TaxID=334858 RepID=A0AAE3GHV7_9PSEU|nr:MFS transporter [Goodfellowiella coeruleoviolacea]MCP2167700.1 MFS transporter, MHS family, alpha-ketoglutarate permease [Goodfellowiella coeruleoviolacea]
MSQSTAGQSAATNQPVCPAQPRRRGLVASGLGNALEWYDWNVYAVFSSVFAASFFPHTSQAAGLLQALAIFAVGFFFRPLGGLLLSAVADRFGRRAGMVLTVGLMACGSLLIAGCPTYEQIGFAAPALLLLARIAQGLSTGGELATTSSYLAELAPPHRRGLFSSALYVSDILGTMAAVATSLALRSWLSAEQLAQWGWRIPFALGAVAGVVTFLIRRAVTETSAFTEVGGAARRTPLLAGVRRHPRASLQVFGMTVGATVWFYLFAVYLPSYAKTANPGAARAIDLASLGAQALFCVVLPVFGWASDRWGRRLWMLVFCGLGALTAVPLFLVLTPSAVSLFLVQALALLVFAFYGSIAPTLMSEMFPTDVRSAGMGFPYAMAVALFGGTAPYLLEWLTEVGQRDLFAWYLAALCLVSLLTSLTLVDRRAQDLRDVR